MKVKGPQLKLLLTFKQVKHVVRSSFSRNRQSPTCCDQRMVFTMHTHLTLQEMVLRNWPQGQRKLLYTVATVQ